MMKMTTKQFLFHLSNILDIHTNENISVVCSGTHTKNQSTKLVCILKI